MKEIGTIKERKKRVRIIHKTLAELFPDNLRTPLHYTSDWELLVAVILSAQCTDERVNIVTQSLFEKYKTLDDYTRTKPETFEQDIYSTGFYKAKTKAILQSAKIIQTHHNGSPPRTMKELLTLPGVGRKTANVVLGHLYDTVEGIAVDTHVMRLAKKFQLTQSDNPHIIEQDLMKLLPQKDWWDFSYRLKAYGRTYSPAHKKNDESDPISIALRRAQ